MTRLPVIDQLPAGSRYDVALVLVRKPQLDGALAVLVDQPGIATVAVMGSNAEGPQGAIEAVGAERVLLGFPGAGGSLDGGVVTYQLVPWRLQPTVLGELDGRTTSRLRRLRTALRRAGFPVRLERHADAWLKTHEVWITAVANAIYAADGDRHRLARTPDALRLMVVAIAEGLSALASLGVPIRPPWFRVLRHLPVRPTLAVLRRVLPTPQVESLAVRHANAARDDEMRQLVAEVADLLTRAPVPAPAWFELARYVDRDVPPIPDGADTSTRRPAVTAGRGSRRSRP